MQELVLYCVSAAVAGAQQPPFVVSKVERIIVATTGSPWDRHPGKLLHGRCHDNTANPTPAISSPKTIRSGTNTTPEAALALSGVSTTAHLRDFYGWHLANSTAIAGDDAGYHRRPCTHTPETAKNTTHPPPPTPIEFLQALSDYELENGLPPEGYAWARVPYPSAIRAAAAHRLERAR